MTSRRVTVRLGAEQSEALHALSGSLGLAEAEILRIGLDALLTRVPRAVSEAATVERVALDPESRYVIHHYAHQLSRAGNNLNQVVRGAHRARWPEDICDGARAAIGEVREAIAEAREVVQGECQ